MNPVRLINFSKYAFRTKDELSDADVKTGIRSLTADGVCSMSMLSLQGGPFLPAFAIALGASNYDVGLLVTIAFLSQLMQLPGLYLMRKIPSRRGTVLLAAGVSRLLWVFIILIPLLFLNRGVTFLMQWLFLAAMIGAIAGPSWNSLLRDIVPEKRLGSVFARRMIMGNVAVLIVMLAGGFFVDAWQGWFPGAPLYAYSILFGCGLLFGLAGLLMIARLPEARRPQINEPSLVTALLKPLVDENFRTIVFFIAAWSFAVNMAAPFFIVYMLTQVGLPLTTITVLFVVSQVTNLVFLRIWGRIADRFSNKSVLAVSAPFFLLAILGWTFTTMPDRYFLTIPILVIIHILSGMSLAGISLGTMNLALKASPKGEAHSYMTVYGVAAACAAAVAPIVAGTFADFFATRNLSIPIQWSEPGREVSVYAVNIRGLDFLFVLAFILGLLALRILRRVKETGEVEEDLVRSEVRNEFVGTLRDVSMVPGVRHFVTIPLASAVGIISRSAADAMPKRNNNADNEKAPTQ